MKMLTQQDYQEIRSWIHREMPGLWIWLFGSIILKTEEEKRSQTQWLIIRMKTEGFGHGIEPDCWNRESSPYATMIAAGSSEEPASWSGRGQTPDGSGDFPLSGKRRTQ